ncbi:MULTISPECIES: arabinofuranosidase catalytic domain-containing protein [unclassified Streptomyces]|uniref:arabinofuranosidase catalytic domain-containing protein n=1 Tax=unclassified Streptomyces TaxID=2593676 RepID=UPI00382CB9DF
MIEMEPLLGPAIGELSPVAAGTLSCDAYGYNGFPCVAAHSTVRALYSYYGGPLYQVQRASDKATTDILPLSAGGYANAATQDSFCASTTCVITKIYDQSPEWNDLTVEGAGGAGGADHGADAAALPVTVNGHKVYGVDIVGQTGYRDNSTTGIAVNGQAEGMYMVASGTHVNSGCCFDYGNAETSTTDTGNGHMDAVNLGTECYFGPCTGSGPWVEADLENGLFSGGNGSDTDNAGNSSKFVTAMLKNNGQTTYALKGGNAQSGSLSTWYSGPLPTRGGYVPMKQEGAIVLGTGGDNSNASIGSFFEGVMTQGYPTDAADNAVQAGIVAAGYDGNSNGAPPAPSAAAPSAAGQAVVHDGYSSVFTVNSANGHLQETYLPKMGDAWSTQDLSAKYNTPPVMAGTQPVALVHCGYTSLYTVDAATGDLQETYLPFMGADWVSQDLSAKYNTPPTNVTPTAVEHTAGASGASTGCGYTSVYTANRNGDLEETYLPNVGFPGDAWHAQDLSVNYSTPQILPGTSPVALVHCGYTSLYTADASNHHLQETYLPAIGQAWHTQDLSANYGTPATDITPTAVVHASGASGASDGCGYTSVYSVDQGSRHLQETYLPNTGFPGDAWHTQDLSANYQTPQVAPGAAPVALVHMNYTSVYTVDQGSDELQETYLPTIGDAWHTQSLSKGYNTPKTDQTPIVLLHPDSAGALDWASVYTVDEFSSHLQETYLSNSGFPGDPWVTQDLSAKYNTPPVYQRQSAPAGWSVVHDGYTSAFTVDASSGHLDESYLTAMNQPWATQDLSKKYSAPNVRTGTVPVGLYHDGYTSVFTVDAGTQHLQETYLPGAASTGIAWHTQDLSAATAGQQVANGTSPTAVFHDGYVSLYTVDAFSGDLRETYLPAAGFPGDPWQTQNLSGKYGTPQVMTGTSPVAIVHDGYTSVYTVAAGTGHLWETYLPFMGSGWSTQDLTANYGTPTTAVTPTAVFHDGYTSVYTVGRQGDLEETYLPYMGGAWRIQDLTTVYGAPKSLNVAPAALYHDGYTSVYYLTGPSDHLEEAYLPAISGPWGYQDLSANVGTPPSLLSPSPLVHYDTSGALTWTSVYTVNSADGHLRETYLSDVGFPGDPWATQDLSAKYSTPSADPPGSVMWSTVSSGESLGYARTIRLASAGAANGTMLSTFEHTAGNGVITGYLIRQSTDNGATWSTRSIVPGDVSSLAPFLYEYPQQVGGLPAGTLMLLGTTVTAGNTHASIREWLSVDHGASWASVGIVQTAGGVGDGVWEPFVRLDNSGNLAMFFSDERQNATYSQFIGEIISTDGGFSWSAHTDGSTSFGPGEIKVVASPFPADRPGMPTVAISKLGGGYVLAYEMCGPQACAVHIKTSADGDSWGSGPTDLGTVPTTADGLFLRGTPVITWAGNGGPSGGTLYLSGRNEASTSGSVPSNQTLILSNQDAGAGSWTEIAAPAIPTVGANTGCNTNYSPDLIPVDGNSTLHYTVAAAAGPYKCEELVASVPIQP